MPGRVSSTDEMALSQPSSLWTASDDVRVSEEVGGAEIPQVLRRVGNGQA